MNLKSKKLLALLCVAGGVFSFIAPTVWASSSSTDKYLNTYCKVHANCNGVAGTGVDYATYNASVLGSDANGVVVVSEYGTCNAQYGDKNKFSAANGYEVKKGHNLSKTCTVYPWETNTHVYQIVKHTGKEIIRIKAKIN